MSYNTEKILLLEMEKILNEIIASYKLKGMRASGEIERESKITHKSKDSLVSASLIMPKHVEQMQWGRRSSTKMPPLSEIYDWIINKRIMARGEKEYKIKGLAFAIARKIQREGFDRSGHGGVKLISDILTDQRINSITTMIGKDILPIFVAEFTNQLKSMKDDNI